MEENSFHRKDCEGEGAEYRTDCDRFRIKKKQEWLSWKAEVLKKKSVNLKYCAEVRDQSVTAGGLAEVKKVERVGLRKEVFTVQQACEMLDWLPSP